MLFKTSNYIIAAPFFSFQAKQANPEIKSVAENPDIVFCAVRISFKS